MTGKLRSAAERIRHLLEEMEIANRVGVDMFEVGKHHRKEFADSAPSVLLDATAACTKCIHLASAVTVLSADDPVRAPQRLATIDLISQGWIEMIVGRGSFVPERVRVLSPFFLWIRL